MTLRENVWSQRVSKLCTQLYDSERPNRVPTLEMQIQPEMRAAAAFGVGERGALYLEF